MALAAPFRSEVKMCLQSLAIPIEEWQSTPLTT
jgi:hypothetical protein